MTIRFRSLALPLMLGALTFAPIAQAVDASLTTQPTYRYQLIDTFEVKGRQGVASDGNYSSKDRKSVV